MNIADPYLREIWRAMAEQGLNTVKAGEISGVNNATIASWRRGHTYPTLTTYLLLAEALGLEVIVRKKRGEADG